MKVGLGYQVGCRGEYISRAYMKELLKWDSLIFKHVKHVKVDIFECRNNLVIFQMASPKNH